MLHSPPNLSSSSIMTKSTDPGSLTEMTKFCYIRGITLHKIMSCLATLKHCSGNFLNLLFSTLNLTITWRDIIFYFKMGVILGNFYFNSHLDKLQEKFAV